MMPGRTYTSGIGYKYGFNGKEQDLEISGIGNQYDYGFRIYNPRIGRFLSVDPLFNGYPWYTPYQFSGNKPIWANDLDGLEENTTSTYVHRPLPVLLAPKKSSILPAPRQYYFTQDNRTQYQIQQAREYAIWRDQMIRVYGSQQGEAFRLFAGVGAAASFVIPEAAAATGVAYGINNESPTLVGISIGLYGLQKSASFFSKARSVASSTNQTTENAIYNFSEQWGQPGLYGSSNKTTTLLGTRDGYWGSVVSNSEKTGINLIANEANNGGFSYLNISNHTFDMTTTAGRQGFFDTFNKPFLDKAIQGGDDILMLDNPFDQRAIFFKGDAKMGLNFFGMEVKYLQEKGFTFMNGKAIPPSAVK